MWFRNQSYAVLPALSVRGPALRRSLRTVTLAWMFGVVWLAMISGSRITIFGRMIGFTNFDFGLMAAMPFLATFGQLFAAILIEQTGLRKYQFLYFGAIHRALWLGVALIPLVLPIPSRLAVAAMLLILGASWFSAAMATPAWWSWMGDLIPRRIRGRFYGNRQRYANIVVIPTVIGMAVLMDAMVRQDEPMTVVAQPMLLWAIVAAFIFAAGCGVVDIMLFRRLREVFPSTKDRPRVPAIRIRLRRPTAGGAAGAVAYTGRYGLEMVRQILLEPLKDRTFRHAVLYLATITAAISAWGPFGWRYTLETLGFSQLAADVLFLVIGPLCGIFAAKIFGRLIDRWGRRPVLFICTFLTLLSALPWLIVNPQTPCPAFLVEWINGLSGAAGQAVGWSDFQLIGPETPIGAFLLLLGSVFCGASGWTGIGLAQTGILLSFSDSPGRSKYLAAAGVLVSLGGVIGGLVGGGVAEYFSELQMAPLQLGLLLWNNWSMTFILSLGFRLLAMLWLIRMPDPGSVPVAHLVRQIRTNTYNYVYSRVFYRWRVYGWPVAPRSERRRRQKVEEKLAKKAEIRAAKRAAHRAAVRKRKHKR